MSPESKSPKITDSVLLGGLSLALSIGSITTMFLMRDGIISGDATLGVAVTWMCASPVIGLVNLIVAARDRRNGRREAATIGALLAGLSVVVGLLPLALAD